MTRNKALFFVPENRSDPQQYIMGNMNTKDLLTLRPGKCGSSILGALALALASLGPWAQAQTVTFDFDTGTPALSTGQGLPIDQSSGGITAHFSTPAGSGGMSVQTDASAQYQLPEMSGHYLLPSSLTPNVLEISFSAALTNISLTFATVDYHDNLETPSQIQLTAFAGTTTVGTNTARAAYGAGTYPTSALSFNSGQAFDKVQIQVPAQPSSLRLFIVDNVTVTTSPIQAPRLTIVLNNKSNVLISWPAPSSGFALQETEALGSPNWVNTTGPVTIVGSDNQVTALTTGNRFYRLYHP
jgi:hypothetical protein